MPCLLFCVVHVNVSINFVCLFFMMNLVAWKMIGVKDFVDHRKGVQKIELKKQEGVWKALVNSKS